MFVLLGRNVGFTPPNSKADELVCVQSNHDSVQSRQKKVSPTEPNGDTFQMCCIHVQIFGIRPNSGLTKQNMLFTWPVSDSEYCQIQNTSEI